jgi:hypothetical protein
MDDRWYCTQCGRNASGVIDGLSGKLGYCYHSDDENAQAKRPVPVVRSEAEARELIEARLDRQALRRALVKAHTEEGRASLSTREARVLADHQPQG